MTTPNSEDDAPTFAPENAEIGLRELVLIIWNGKWLLCATVLVFAVLSVLLALSLPDRYRSTAVLVPTGSADQGVNVGALGGLASLAGLSGLGDQSNDTVVAMNIMQSWEFIDRFLRTYDLEPAVLAAVDWRREGNELVYDAKVYDPSRERWLDEELIDQDGQPRMWWLVKYFNEDLAVSQERDTGLVKVSFIHYSPHVAQRVVGLLIDDINELMRARGLDEATRTIDYLNQQVEKSTQVEIRQALYALIQEQMQTRMLAEVKEDYAFQIVSPPPLPEEEAEPSRALIAIGGTFLGAILGLLLVMLRHQLRR